MAVCENADCVSLRPADKRCSGCKYAFYCSERCQKADWPTHKKGCAINAKLREINEAHAAQEAAKAQTKPPTTHCTGCDVQFDSDGEYGEEECPDCGYIACESCACHNSRGSCYCANSNFGRKYCEMEPAWYHMSSRTGRAYQGDRHPIDHWNEFDPKAFEKTPRKCGNCGEIAKCLKKEWL